jgi:hypothetical protein
MVVVLYIYIIPDNESFTVVVEDLIVLFHSAAPLVDDLCFGCRTENIRSLYGAII